MIKYLNNHPKVFWGLCPAASAQRTSLGPVYYDGQNLFECLKFLSGAKYWAKTQFYVFVHLAQQRSITIDKHVLDTNVGKQQS